MKIEVPKWKWFGTVARGRKKAATVRNRQFRRQAKKAIRNEEELPVRRKQVSWDIL